MARDGLFSPRDFLAELEIPNGAYIADFGSGTGNFAVELAKRVGSDGRVFAFDIRTPALQALKGKMRSHALHNIQVVRADLETEHGTGLPEAYVDMVLIHNIILQVNNREILLEEARRILKPDGFVLAVEWAKDSPIGPPHKTRMRKEDLIELFEQNQLYYDGDVQAGRYHYGVTFYT